MNTRYLQTDASYLRSLAASRLSTALLELQELWGTGAPCGREAWELLSSMAASRLFRVAPATYEYADRAITALGRTDVIRVAVESILDEPFEAYFDSLTRMSSLYESEEFCLELALFHLVTSSAWAWALDNYWAEVKAGDEIPDMLTELREMLNRHLRHLDRLLRASALLRKAYGDLIALSDSRFLDTRDVRLLV